MTQADKLRAEAVGLVGMEYEWADEFDLHVGPDATKKETDGDCSGTVFRSYRKAGVPWKNGGLWQRLTAHGYCLNAKATGQPYRTGDVACFWYSGIVKHIALLISATETVEARGEKYGVVRYKVSDGRNGVLARGARIYRFPWVDLGELSQIRPTLDYGDTGEAVRQAQRELNDHMGRWLSVTGNFRGVTLAMTEQFQDLYGLEVDGVIGKMTWAALVKTPATPLLSAGATGDWVRLEQRLLEKAGHDLVVDGEHGPKTTAALMKFQRVRLLPETGQADAATWGKLRAV